MDHLLRVEEVAELFHVHPETVRIWLRKGDLPGRKVGKCWYVAEDDVRAMMKGGDQHGSTEGAAPATSRSDSPSVGGRSMSASASRVVVPRIIG